MPTSTKNDPKILPWLFAAVFLDHTSINIIFPVLTVVCFDSLSSLFSPDASMAVRGMWYGLIISTYHLVNIIAAPVFGIASDYLGRRKLLIITGTGALFMGGLASLGMLFGSIMLVLAGRIIGGLCATKAVTQAAVGDIPAGKHKVLNMGYLQAIIALGALIGPVIGGFTAKHFYSATLNFSMPFIIATVFALLSLGMVIIKFPETLSHKASPNWSAIKRSLKIICRNPAVIKISLVLLLSQISWSMYYQYMPPILKDRLGFNATQLGLFLSAIAFWLVLAGSIGIKWLKQRLSLTRLIQRASMLTLLGLLVTVISLTFHYPGHNLVIWISAIPIAAGDMLAYIVLTTLYSDTVAPEQQGLVMGICLVVAQLVWFITGLLGGVLVGIHFIAPLLLAPTGVVILLVLLQLKPQLLNQTETNILK